MAHVIDSKRGGRKCIGCEHNQWHIARHCCFDSSNAFAFFVLSRAEEVPTYFTTISECSMASNTKQYKVVLPVVKVKP